MRYDRAFLVRSLTVVNAMASDVPCELCFPFPQNRIRLISFLTPGSAPSIGHGFGGIPAPGSFVSSAFPFPPKKSPGTAQEIFCAPPEMQTLALGADPSRFRVPQLRGQKGDSKMYVIVKWNRPGKVYFDLKGVA